MKTFQVPPAYRSPLITAVKNKRKQQDKMKKDFTPALLDFGTLKIYLARHFGFCYGVENAIEIAFRTVDENPGKRIFLLSEMIHNPIVNADLEAGARLAQVLDLDVVLPPLVLDPQVQPDDHPAASPRNSRPTAAFREGEARQAPRARASWRSRSRRTSSSRRRSCRTDPWPSR